MKLVLPFITILVLSLSAFGQIILPSVKKAQEKEDWRVFAPAGEEFVLEMPGEPIPGAINTMADKTNNSRSYRIFVGGVYYYVFSDALKTPDQYKVVLTFAESIAPGIRQNVIYSFADNYGFHHRILMVKTDYRIYTFQTVSPTKDNPSLSRFFSDIRIKGDFIQAQNVSGVNPLQTKTDSDTVQTPVAGDNSSGKTSPTANNQGRGIGSGSGSDAPALANAPNPAQTTPLKLLSKPRPAYTDYARFYQITGVVRLRITFLASGAIGSISPPAAKLPFGLTNQAIEAARAVKFEPATINGVPVTVSKQIEYSFSIY